MPDAQTVTSVKHWTDRLFSFRVTRPKSLRFRSGEFVMIGLLKDDGKPLLRAYSIASPSWDDELEFYSIKVQDGPLTSRLQHLKVNDQIILRPKPVGTLVHDALLPGRRLWLFATGTGIAPFASLIRDPQTFEDYDQVILTHTCRELAELEYGRLLVEGLSINDFSPLNDRAMVCGSIGLNLEIKSILDDLGFKEGANSEPAQYVVEKAFVG